MGATEEIYERGPFDPPFSEVDTDMGRIKRALGQLGQEFLGPEAFGTSSADNRKVPPRPVEEPGAPPTAYPREASLPPFQPASDPRSILPNALLAHLAAQSASSTAGGFPRALDGAAGDGSAPQRSGAGFSDAGDSLERLVAVSEKMLEVLSEILKLQQRTKTISVLR